MRKTIQTLLTLLALGAAAAPALANPACLAQTHTRFGETRAYFQDVLGACRPDGYCSAVIALADPSGQTAALQQLRIARPTPGAPYQLELSATTPMPVNPHSGLRFTVARQTTDLDRMVLPTALNEYRVTDQAVTDRLVSQLRAARNARWKYDSDEGGTHTAIFPLRGVTAALTWIDCMGAQAGR